MARQNGVFRFTGSLKGIRNFKRLHDPNIYASEKGGVSRETEMNHPNFANTRLSQCEFAGCAKAVKSIRIGFAHMIPDMVDTGFTSRLMQFTRKVSQFEGDGKKGKRSLLFSAHRSYMQTLYFTKKKGAIDSAKIAFWGSHDDSRVETTLDVKRLSMSLKDIPSGAEFFRVFSHLCIVSDYRYSEETKCYEPTNLLDGLNTVAYSEYGNPGVEFTTALTVAFPEGTLPGEDCSVVHSAGIEFYVSNGPLGLKTIYGPKVVLMNVF